MSPSYIAVAVSIASLLFVIFQYFSNRKYQVTKDQQKELDEKIQGVKASIEKDHRNLSLESVALEKRVRKVESIQITEARVQSMLDGKVQPLQNDFKNLGEDFKSLGASFNKLEEDIKSHHRDISMEINRAHQETNAHIMKIVSELSHLGGVIEARRKDDSRRN